MKSVLRGVLERLHFAEKRKKTKTKTKNVEPQGNNKVTKCKHDI